MNNDIYVYSPKLNAAKTIHAFILVIGVPAIIWAALYWNVLLPLSPLQVVALAGFYTLTFWGITVGYHRLISHKAFSTPPAMEVILAIFGSMAMQGPVFYWVANHRRHHRFADRGDDPHSPVYTERGKSLGAISGFFYSHLSWIFTHRVSNPLTFCRDAVQNPGIRFVNRTYKIWVIVGLVVPPLIDYAIHRDPRSAANVFFFFGPIRIFITYHITSCINSLCHQTGYRNYRTKDNSHNIYALSLLSLGESFHNNHHRKQRCAKFSHKWYEVDLGYSLIRFLELIGLADDVNKDIQAPRGRPTEKETGKAS